MGEASEAAADAAAQADEVVAAAEEAAVPEEPVQVAVRSAMTVEQVSERRNWLTGGDRGTLTQEGLAAVIDACEARAIAPRACAARVANRVEPFAALSDAVAREAVLLLRACGGSRAWEQCRQDVEDERYVRDQDIGRAEPNTLAMRQYEPILWSVAIRRSDLQVTPGSTTVVEESAQRDPQSGRTPVGNAITYTESTCFVLEYDEAAFAVDEARVCPEYRRGSTPYTARWRVEPLKSGTQQLWVKAVHQRGARTLPAETVPTSPFPIEVEHWLVKILRELGLWNEVAAAIGTLMATVAGWGIWKLIRRRGSAAEEEENERAG